MSTITFFRQARVDGGIRTGIDVDDVTWWHHFDAGGAEEDPALIWYVDLRCEGSTLPGDKDAARRWLLDHAPLIQAAFRELAEKLRLGFDNEFAPYQHSIAGAREGTTMTVVCSAVRRLEARSLAKVLDDIGKRWEQLLQQLAPEMEVSW